MTRGPADPPTEQGATDVTEVRRPGHGGGLRRTFQGLQTRNYRLFFTGQIVSVVGTWMQRVAQDWLILELGGGALELSIGLALQSGPVLLLGMWGGLLSDRHNTRRVLLVSQIAFAVLALILGVLVLTDTATLGLVYVMAFGLGIANIVDKPARHSFVLELVGTDGAANAVSLNSSINNSARLIGPAVASAVIAVSGTAIAFLVNAGTFAAIIVALLMMDPKSLHPRETAPAGRGQVMEGLRSSMSRPELRTPLLATLIVSTLSQNFRVTLPLMATQIFGRGVGGYGLLMSALGVGALVGALATAHLARPTQRLAGLASLGMGAALLLGSVAPAYALLAVLMVGVGVGSTSFNATSQTLLLLRSDSDKRGRLMATRELFSNGLSPVGVIGIGWVCAATSPRVALTVGGIAAICAALLLFRDRGQVSDEDRVTEAPAGGDETPGSMTIGPSDHGPITTER
ncbi:MAG: MFS transporter [Actinomycetota bacterium]